MLALVIVQLLVGSPDKTVNLWSVTSGECVKTFEGHSNCVTSVAMSRDGLYIVSGSSDETVSVTSGECVFSGPRIPSLRRAEFPPISDFFEHFDDTDTMVTVATLALACILLFLARAVSLLTTPLLCLWYFVGTCAIVTILKRDTAYFSDATNTL